VLDQPLGLFDNHFETWTWRVGGSSNVEETTSPFTVALHVGDFFRPLVDQQDDQIALRMVGVIECAMFCKSTVLPVRGGATIRVRAGPCPAARRCR
jgi:hypothetical protein